MGVCNCSMYCCTLLYVHYSIAIILMGKGELIALLNLSSWCLVMVERLFLTVPRGCLQFVIVVFPDHNHLLFLKTTPKLSELHQFDLDTPDENCLKVCLSGPFTKCHHSASVNFLVPWNYICFHLNSMFTK